MTFEIRFTRQEIEELGKSPWLQEVAQRKIQALQGNTDALKEISKNGKGREEILGWYDTGQLNLNHLREGRQPDQRNLPKKGLQEVMDELSSETCPGHVISVDLRDRTKTVVAAIRELVIAAIMKETGRIAIETGLIQETSDTRTLANRTEFGDVEETAKQRARERYDRSDELKDDSFDRYLDLELNEDIDLNGEGIDIHMVKVAVNRELAILRELLSAYDDVDFKDGKTEKMLQSAKEITIPALEALRDQIAERLGEVLEDMGTDKEEKHEPENKPGCTGWLIALTRYLLKRKITPS